MRVLTVLRALCAWLFPARPARVRVPARGLGYVSEERGELGDEPCYFRGPRS